MCSVKNPNGWKIEGAIGVSWSLGFRLIRVGATSYHYHKVSNIRRTLVGNKIVDHSDVVGASNYIFILNLTPGLNGLGKENYKMRREAFKSWDLVGLILETLR